MKKKAMAEKMVKGYAGFSKKGLKNMKKTFSKNSEVMFHVNKALKNK